MKALQIYSWEEDEVNRDAPLGFEDSPYGVARVKYAGNNWREFWMPRGVDLVWRGHVRKMEVRRPGEHFNEMVPFLRGFLSDLGVIDGFDLSAPNGNLLATNNWEKCRPIDWPRILEDEVADELFQIEPPPATPDSIHPPSGNVPMRDFAESGRGESDLDRLVDQIPVERVLFQTTSDPDSPTRIWWSDGNSVDGSHTEHGTWPELLDAFFRKACIVRRSRLEEWMRANVVHGRFLLPGPDEVEVYRMLGEQLPLLWPDDRFCPWILGQE